jgi:MbtH protein
MFDEDDAVTYAVVINHEEQYSIWPDGRELPPGWQREGTVGNREACLARIDEVWTDMRPLSLRRWMDENADADPGEGSVADRDDQVISR